MSVSLIYSVREGKNVLHEDSINATTKLGEAIRKAQKDANECLTAFIEKNKKDGIQEREREVVEDDEDDDEDEEPPSDAKKLKL
jgi:low affinity Fe/Cu permease